MKLLANNKGFTLIELMLSVTIFSLAVVIAGDVFISVMRNQKKNLGSQDVEEASRYALEVMSKEIRNVNGVIGAGVTGCTSTQTGQNDKDDANYYSGLEINGGNERVINNNKGEGEGEMLAFRDKFGKCVKYYLAGNRIWINRVRNDIAVSLPITPANIKITKLSFFISDSGDRDDQLPPPPPPQSRQHSVTVSFVAQEGNQKLNTFQTTVVSRVYEDIN